MSSSQHAILEQHVNQKDLFFDHEQFATVSPLDYWRLVIDGKQQLNPEELGWYKYNQREPGSVSALMRAYEYMLTTVNKAPLTENLLKEFHKKVLDTKRNIFYRYTEKPGEYRQTAKVFNIIKGDNATENGFEMRLNREPKEVNFEIWSLNTPDRVKLVPMNGNPVLISSKVQEIISQFYKQQAIIADDEIADNQEKRRQILKNIARCIQNLELTHPFPDGNCRAICIITLNKLLLDNHFSPVIMEDPNRFDGYTVDELVDEIESGMLTFRNIASMTPATTEIIKQQIEKDINSLHTAIYLGIPEVVIQMLPYANANINYPNEFGKSALMIAAMRGQEYIVKELLLHPDIDINQNDQFGYTAAKWAIAAGHTHIATIILNDQRSNPIADDDATSVMAILASPSLQSRFERLNITKTLLPYDQGVTQKERMLFKVLNYLLGKAPPDGFNLIELISFYSALMQITAPILRKTELLSEVRTLILGIDLQRAVKPFYMREHFAELITYESLAGLPFADLFETLDLNNSGDFYRKMISVYETKLSNINELLLLVARIDCTNKEELATKYAPLFSWDTLQVQYITNLRETLRLFPEQADVILKAFVNEPEAFLRLVNYRVINNKVIYPKGEFRTLLKYFPQHSEIILDIVTKNKQVFSNVFLTNSDLEDIMKKCPHYSDFLFKFVLANDEEFKRLISFNYALCKTAKAFPQYADLLINRVLANDVEFKQLIKSKYELRNTVAAFPRFTAALVVRFNQHNNSGILHPSSSSASSSGIFKRAQSSGSTLLDNNEPKRSRRPE